MQAHEDPQGEDESQTQPAHASVRGVSLIPPSMTATHCPCQSNAWFGAVEQLLDVILCGANALSPEGEDE